MTTSTVIIFSPKSLCLHILSWPHCPSYLGVICDPCLSLGFPSKCPASPGVLTVFLGNGSHLFLPVSCYCCPCSGLCASFQMDSQSPCALHEVPSSSPAFLSPSPIQTLGDPHEPLWQCVQSQLFPGWIHNVSFVARQSVRAVWGP